MDYLALCKKVHLMVRIGEETPGTQPAAVTGQTGVLAEMVQWVTASHDDICKLHTDWAFMRGSTSFTLALGDRILTKAEMVAAVPTFGKVAPFVTDNGAFIGITPVADPGAAEEIVEYVPYQEWQGAYDAPPIQTGRPTHFTIAPDQSMEFSAIPDQAYSVRTNYRKKVVPLAANTDQPMLDEDYHNLIVYWAVVHYYCLSRDKTQELRAKADAGLKRELTKLRNEQLPAFTAF